MSSEQQVALTFPSMVEYLNLVHTVTDEMSRLAGFDAEASLNISLAVREAATNAVIHGNDRDTSKNVHVEFAVEKGRITVTILDEGEGFEPEQVADPTDPTNVARTSGRGIFLMRSFMDSVEFQKRAERGMECFLEKRVET